MLNDEEFGYVHINTRGKQLSEEEMEEEIAFLKNKELEEMVEKAKDSHKRVKESKITDRTKM
ncbi:hypothetical protein K2V58_08195 [Staphylococcus arlettae]|nr:hypothetical protein [Staphylococcus arlettae]MCD8864993.1 hypothetical protein [Staphylococcus arlettae]QZZ04719.1 hypothetical protein K7H07_03195 [Staphylococcus arlettae]